ncbi:hypothetical protein D3C86_2159680 [compost metagenome]
MCAVAGLVRDPDASQRSAPEPGRALASTAHAGWSGKFELGGGGRAGRAIGKALSAVAREDSDGFDRCVFLMNR